MDASAIDSRLKKVSSNRSARTLSAVALLALVPAVAFGLSKDLPSGAVTAVNVTLIFGSLYLLVSPVEDGDDGHDAEDVADAAN